MYLDTSAIVKKYVPEPGSAEVIDAIGRAQSAGTALIARAEVAAAFGKAVRTGLLRAMDGESCLRAFRKDWSDYYVCEVTKAVVTRAESFAWTHHLRGYDAVHLAAACLWQDDLGQRVTLATFDVSLWRVAETAGLLTYPPNLPQLVEQWSR